ncbi:MAG: hypothetical protein CSA75_03055 [Sorangium cellulosum]|nr:MAG: hypothetical protein CSA75_03055 [Sorangium cellulosum]
MEKGAKFSKSIEYKLLPGQRSTRDIRINGDIVVKKNAKFNRLAIRKLKQAKIERLPIEHAELLEKVAAHDVINMETGEVILECNDTIATLRSLTPRTHSVLCVLAISVKKA